MSKGRSNAVARASGMSSAPSVSRSAGSDSGSGTFSGMGSWCSNPSAGSWKDAITDRMVFPCW